ncbi:MAG: DUF47 family protein [Planctomycetota bacterium]|nr:DUF47 family protein [Planctomycetota bacterium]
MFFANKQKKVQDDVALYCEKVSDCLDAFHRSIRQYCDEPDKEAIKSNFTEVHKAESLADNIRRQIEVLMYSKALFPESRGDILGLLETMDRVPNQAESVVRMIRNQYVPVPEALRPGILRLAEVCRRSVDAMIDAADKMFTDYTNATVAVGKIDELESEADRIESDLIEQIFSGQMDGFNKIILRDLVKNISQIADRAENVGDRIRIMVAKRIV